MLFVKGPRDVGRRESAGRLTTPHEIRGEVRSLQAKIGEAERRTGERAGEDEDEDEGESGHVSSFLLSSMPSTFYVHPWSPS